MEYLAASGLWDSAIDLYQQQEFVRLIDHFFDRVLCYTGESADRLRSFVAKDAPQDDSPFRDVPNIVASVGRGI